MGPLPPELARSSSQRIAWPPQWPPEQYSQPYRYPLSEFLPTGYHPMNSDATIASNMSELLDRTHLSEADGGPVDGTSSAMPQPTSNWSRSFQNPVGNVYYPPSDTDDRWGLGATSNTQSQEIGGNTPPTPPYGYYGGGLYRQDSHQFRFHDPRPPQAALGIFLPKPNKPPQMALGSFLPMPYGGVAPSDVSPNSRRSVKSQRPYSADVNQLFAVSEGSTRSSGGSSFKKGKQIFFREIKLCIIFNQIIHNFLGMIVIFANFFNEFLFFKVKICQSFSQFFV